MFFRFYSKFPACLFLYLAYTVAMLVVVDWLVMKLSWFRLFEKAHCCPPSDSNIRMSTNRPSYCFCLSTYCNGGGVTRTERCFVSVFFVT